MCDNYFSLNSTFCFNCFWQHERWGAAKCFWRMLSTDKDDRYKWRRCGYWLLVSWFTVSNLINISNKIFCLINTPVLIICSHFCFSHWLWYFSISVNIYLHYNNIQTCIAQYMILERLRLTKTVSCKLFVTTLCCEIIKAIFQILHCYITKTVLHL